MTTPVEPTTFSALSGGIGRLVADLGPRIVSVFARDGRPSNGFVFDSGLVLAPAHAIHRDHDLSVRTLDGTRCAATLAGRDDATNVAVLRVESLAGHSACEAVDVAPGSLVLALARHRSGPPAAALSLVQAAGAATKAWRGQAFDRVLQLDRGLPALFAGAPLVDPEGRLAGMVLAGELRAAGLAAGGAGVLDVARTLARDGGVARGYLGVMCQSARLTPVQAETAGTPQGLLIVGVAEDGAASAAGVLVGDLLLRFGDETMADAEALHARLTRERAGSVCRIALLRGASLVTLDVTLGSRERRG